MAGGLTSTKIMSVAGTLERVTEFPQLEQL